MVQQVLVAPDKFKGSLTAAEVSAHVSAGLGVPTVELPVADGGDGTVDAAVAGGFGRVTIEVTGPTGQRIPASYAWQESGATAVVELSEASGLRRLPGGREPLTATSYGTGELIADAVRRGAKRVVLGLGGSACTDGGAGLAQALGARLLDADGNELARGGAALKDLDRIDLSDFTDISGVEFVVASDVDNPLLGPHGAAAVYGPQKGATAEDVRTLEAALARLAAVGTATHGLMGAPERRSSRRESEGRANEERSGRDHEHEHDDTPRAMGVAGAPGAGAAGGVGFAALAFLHAEIRPGIDYLLDLLGFGDLVKDARLVITGEGSLDEQSLRGKAPIGVAQAAARAGVPVVAVCGRRTLSDDALRAAGIEAAYALTDLEPDPERCMAEAGPLLERLAARLAAIHLQGDRQGDSGGS
ncbi:glycerate kinase [Nonomuraea phyllanthi]|uniref:Glycerate kinase n=1 Tax=Nonomuraea phyllanthi TaxID=2219224 RepID=A0A5C4WA30_9ACTN|nr:glycerate kinase [Nonomuraea phyllanthi]KAB8192819.1 glycerate kinase [Nonomuraea phyllanthi]